MGDNQKQKLSKTNSKKRKYKQTTYFLYFYQLEFS